MKIDCMKGKKEGFSYENENVKFEEFENKKRLICMHLNVANIRKKSSMQWNTRKDKSSKWIGNSMNQTKNWINFLFLIFSNLFLSGYVVN